MTVEKRLNDALLTLGYPVYNGVAYGKDEVYFVMNLATVPTYYADDTAEFERWLGMVNLYAPLSMNIVTLKRDTKRAIHDAGFTWPATEDASNEEERHIVFEFEDAEEADDGET